MRELPDVGTAQPLLSEAAETWERTGAPVGEKMKGRWGWALKLRDHASALLEETHTHYSGPLGPEEMSVCGFTQPPVPVLMMASTCCFNVTAGSPSIPHWLWLPSAAGSSPLLSSLHLSFLHLPALPSCLSPTTLLYSTCPRSISHITSFHPFLELTAPPFLPSYLSQSLSLFLSHFYSAPDSFHPPVTAYH